MIVFYGKRDFAGVIKVPNQLNKIQMEVILGESDLPNQASLSRVRSLAGLEETQPCCERRVHRAST